MHAVYLKKPDGNLSLCWMTIEGRNVACVFQNHTEASSYVQQLRENSANAMTYLVFYVGDVDAVERPDGNA